MTVDSAKGQNWVEILFVRYPQLYLPILQKKTGESLVDVDGLCHIFEQFGLRKGIKILDLCCGIGRHAIPLAKRGYEVVGLDISQYYVKLARARAKREGINRMKARFYQGDAKDVIKVLKKQTDGDFDVIISMFQSLGYKGPNFDLRVIEDLLKVSRNRALLVLELENRDWWFVNFQPYFQYQFNDAEIYEAWDLDVVHSTANAHTRFYKRIGEKKLQLELELECSMRLYSIHEIISAAQEVGWTYLMAFESLQNLEPFRVTSKQMILVFRTS